MQFAEILLILFVTGNVFYFIWGKPTSRPLAYIGLSLFVLHFLLEGARWQMAPIYLTLILTIAIHYFGWTFKKWLRVVGYGLAFMLLIFGSALSYALPVFELPKPTGPFAVASQYLYVKDESRPESITEAPDDYRELMIEVFYPAAESTQTYQYLTDEDRKGFALKYGLPPQTLHYLDGVNTFVQQDAVTQEGVFPVLLFSPGYHTPASGYQSILADIASHGYAIFSINHSYETIASHFPDGRVLQFHQEYATNNYWSDEMGKAVDEFDSAIEAEKREAVKEANRVFKGGAPIVARWAADVTSVIDAIEAWNTDPAFALEGQLNLDQIGVFGHSRGGAGAVEASIFDQRIKAAVNLDGAQWGHVVDSTLHTPVAVLSSTSSVLYDVNQYIYQESKGAHFYDVALANSGHSNFSDIPYMVRIPQLNEAGSIAPYAATASFNRFLLAFFRKHLQGEKVDLNEVVENDEHLSWK